MPPPIVSQARERKGNAEPESGVLRRVERHSNEGDYKEDERRYWHHRKERRMVGEGADVAASPSQPQPERYVGGDDRNPHRYHRESCN